MSRSVAVGLFLIALAIFLTIGASCGPAGNRTEKIQASSSGNDSSEPAGVDFKRADISRAHPERCPAHAGLKNVFRLTPSLYCGSEPGGDAGFDSLERLGVKTIVSVDGATPDVERAGKRGIRYVHLPIGYDGVPLERGRNLAYVVEDIGGTIYVHCHKGVHRGPAAAAYALVSLHRMDADDAVAFLHTAGTSENYPGLYKSVERAAGDDSAPGPDFKPDLPATAKRADLTMYMVDIDHTWERLDACRMSDWNAPVDHPDVDCAAECVILKEHFRESRRLPEVGGMTPEFDRLLAKAEAAADALAKAVRAQDATREAAFREMQNQCNSCHEAYRN